MGRGAWRGIRSVPCRDRSERGGVEEARGLESKYARGDASRLAFYIAGTFAALGENAQALDWLERAYEARVGLLIYVKVDYRFYPLHGEPRFQALLEKMGFPE